MKGTEFSSRRDSGEFVEKQISTDEKDISAIE